MVGEEASRVIPHVLDGLHCLYLRIYQYGKRWIDVDNCFKGVQDGLDHTKTIKRGKQEIQVCSTGIANDKLFQLIIGERIVCENADEQRIEAIIAPYEGLLDFVMTIGKEYEI